MFRQLKNIDSAFRYVRLVTILVMLFSFGLCAFLIISYQFKQSQQDKRILVIANGKIFEAFADERAKYWPIEIRDHVRTFHSLFYTLIADEKAIYQNINRSLFLADNSAANEFKNLKENGYFTSLVAAGVTQEISCDSITVDMNTTPWRFRYYGTLRITRATSIVTRSLITEGGLRTTLATDNNPHGLLIERWQVLENNTIKQENR